MGRLTLQSSANRSPDGSRERQGQSWTGRMDEELRKALWERKREYFSRGSCGRPRPSGSTRERSPTEEFLLGGWRVAGRRRRTPTSLTSTSTTASSSGSPRGDGASEVRSKRSRERQRPVMLTSPPKPGLDVNRGPPGRRRSREGATPSRERGGHGVSRDKVRSSLTTESWIAEIDRYGSWSSPGESPVSRSTGPRSASGYPVLLGQWREYWLHCSTVPR